MKKILLLVLFLASSLFADIKWHGYDEGMALAKKDTTKIVMVMLEHEGCSSCAYMEGVVFKDARVQKVINKDFIAVDVDTENDFIPDGMSYIGTPTFYFMNANAKVLYKLQGAYHVPDFLGILQKVKAKR
jgi:thioredoxin-related protein